MCPCNEVWMKSWSWSSSFRRNAIATGSSTRSLWIYSCSTNASGTSMKLEGACADSQSCSLWEQKFLTVGFIWKAIFIQVCMAPVCVFHTRFFLLSEVCSCAVVFYKAYVAGVHVFRITPSPCPVQVSALASRGACMRSRVRLPGVRLVSHSVASLLSLIFLCSWSAATRRFLTSGREEGDRPPERPLPRAKRFLKHLRESDGLSSAVSTVAPTVRLQSDHFATPPRRLRLPSPVHQSSSSLASLLTRTRALAGHNSNKQLIVLYGSHS